jgi:ATP-independent RNA helicase DbpA
VSKQPFSDLNLPSAQVENLTQLGYKHMTEIQLESLPLALAGKDLIAQAKTGSGKTAAFALPLLNKLNPRDFGAQALVLCPTRELSTQVANEIRRLARYQQNIKVVTLCGGQSIGPQIGSLEHGAHVIVGTPGRIKDHLRKETLDISRVNTVVLDEADRMLDMGFIDDMELIIEQTPAKRQTLLFSATFPKDIEKLSQRFQRSPITIKVESLHAESNIEQQFYIHEKEDKLEALYTLIAYNDLQQAVIFCNTKHETFEVANYLKDRGMIAEALNGDLEQRDRDQVLVQFSHHSAHFLVATDVAARGLDIDDLPAVINYEIPRDSEVYVHRIGRTGRAGKSGLALSLFNKREHFLMERLGEYLGADINFQPVTDLERDARVRHFHVAMPPMVTLAISGGRKDKVRPGDLLGALTGDAGIPGSSVGKINVMDFQTYVAISQGDADDALERLRNGKIKGRKFKVRRV